MLKFAEAASVNADLLEVVYEGLRSSLSCREKHP